MMTDPLVTVIIPVYNAGDRLMIALNSIEKQNYSQLEIIMINDCSTDNSLKIMFSFIDVLDDLKLKGKVINHKQNKGVAAARNTGLDYATGEYIYYLDADDWLEPDAIELMVQEAIKTKADIVGINWWLSFEQNERRMNQPEFSDPWQAIEWMMIGKMRWNLWMFLVRRDLYEAHSIRFVPDMNMGEDMAVMIKLFIHAETVSYLDKALYHYGQSNTESLTKIYSEKHIDEVNYYVKEVECFLLNSKYGLKSERLINYLKLNIKLPLLISNKDSQFARWRSWFPEVNKFATANKDVAGRIRLLQWAAANKQDWIVKLHYYLVIRLVYGVIYK